MYVFFLQSLCKRHIWKEACWQINFWAAIDQFCMMVIWKGILVFGSFSLDKKLHQHTVVTKLSCLQNTWKYQTWIFIPLFHFKTLVVEGLTFNDLLFIILRYNIAFFNTFYPILKSHTSILYPFAVRLSRPWLYFEGMKILVKNA